MDAMQLISDPHRRELLRLVWDEEQAAGDLAAHFSISFGAVSQHLRRLRDADLVTVRADGNFRYYRANTDRLAPFAPMLEAMWGGFLEDLARRAEADGG
jgi:DNA-binding transcriptional ArsR family regulator